MILTTEEVHDISCRHIMIAVHMNKFLVTSIQAAVHLSEEDLSQVFEQGKFVIGQVNGQIAVLMKTIEKANRKKHSLKMILLGDPKEVDQVMDNTYYILSQLTKISSAMKEILTKFQNLLAKEDEDPDNEVSVKKDLADEIANCTELVRECALTGKKLYTREFWTGKQAVFE